MIDSYSKLTVGKYKELKKITDDFKDLDEVEMQTKMLAVLTDMTEDELLNLPISEYKKLIIDSSFLNTQPEAKGKISDKIKLNSNTYRVNKDVKKLTTAQYIDYSNIMNNKPEDSITELLSIFIVPEGKKYNDGYDILDVVKDIDEYMSIETALSVCFFFRKESESLIRATLLYLKFKLRRMKRKNPEMREKTMEAEKQLTRLSEAMDSYLGLIHSQRQNG